MRHHRTVVLVALAGIAAVVIVACTLNPQPLPPEAFSDGDRNSDASADGGSFGNPPPANPSDAAGTGKDSDADAEGDDAGDAGDAADADGG